MTKEETSGVQGDNTAQGLPASEQGQDTNSGRSDSAADAGSSGWEMLKWSEMLRAVGWWPEEAEGGGGTGPFPIPGVCTPGFCLVSAVLPAQLKTSGNPAAAPVCTLE